MNETIKKYTKYYFGALISKYGFKKKSKTLNDESCLIEYISESYAVKVEKYHREFYPTVYSLTDVENEIGIFNLLGFLKREERDIPKSDFFRNEKDIEEIYRKQLIHISSAIFENLDSLNDFFSRDKYKENVMEFHCYWKGKHPELYKTL